MKRRFLITAILALAVAVGGWAALRPDRPAALDLAEPAGGAFTLNALSGPVSLADFRGKVVLIYFGYTFCPDVCPTSLALIAQALNGLEADELAHVQAVFISVDPDRDTSEQLDRYTDYFHPGIVGVTGSEADVADVATRYGAAYRKVEGESAGGYLIDHTSMTYIVSADGSLVRTLPHGSPPPDIIAAIREYLPEST
ncbi:MAG: SCO family protein [Proteobacteria bacterium]|nr:MAG: SCO family protein [Pseudomonadota bacterium]